MRPAPTWTSFASLWSAMIHKYLDFFFSSSNESLDVKNGTTEYKGPHAFRYKAFSFTRLLSQCRPDCSICSGDLVNIVCIWLWKRLSLFLFFKSKVHSENKSKHFFSFQHQFHLRFSPMWGLLRCLGFLVLPTLQNKNKIKLKIIKESSNLDIHQPGKQTLPANRSPTIVKKNW